MSSVLRVLLIVLLAVPIVVPGLPARAAAPGDAADVAALTGRITDDLPSLADLRISIIAPDATARRVQVFVAGDVAVAQRVLRDRYGDAIQVSVGDEIKPLAAPPCVSGRTACPPVMRGGLQLMGTFLTICTSGVEARLTRTGEIGVLTAGHCFGNGEPVTHAGIPLGPATPRQVSGEVDAAFVTHSLVAPTFLPSNWVFYSNADQERSITSVQPIATEAVGQALCRAGRTTGARCGSIVAVGATVVVGAVTLRNQRVTNICALPGDSGGPFLSANTFRGIASAGNWVMDGNGNPACNANPFSTYSAAERIESALGVKVLTSSPLL